MSGFRVPFIAGNTIDRDHYPFGRTNGTAPFGIAPFTVNREVCCRWTWRVRDWKVDGSMSATANWRVQGHVQYDPTHSFDFDIHGTVNASLTIADLHWRRPDFANFGTPTPPNARFEVLDERRLLNADSFGEYWLTGSGIGDPAFFHPFPAGEPGPGSFGPYSWTITATETSRVVTGDGTPTITIKTPVLDIGSNQGGGGSAVSDRPIYWTVGGLQVPWSFTLSLSAIIAYDVIDPLGVHRTFSNNPSLIAGGFFGSPSGPNVNIGTIDFDAAGGGGSLPFVSVDYGATSPVANFTIVPTLFWPYQTKGGADVWDTASGAQVNDPFS
jgi:hypothetical protein